MFFIYLKMFRKNYTFYVYIMASLSGVLYIGFTNNLHRRVIEHKNNFNDGFTKKYRCHRLVYYEDYKYVWDAINREKQLKKWRRKKKLWLIKNINPYLEDLSEEIGLLQY